MTEAITTPGTYYVGVSGAVNSNYNPRVSNSGSVGSTGDYQIIVKVLSSSSVSTEVEPNNQIGTPNVIGPSGNVAGAIATSGDADFYMFTIKDCGPIHGGGKPKRGSSLHSRLTLYGSDQTPWQTSDAQSAANLNPQITVNLVPGSYFLKIESSTNSAGAPVRQAPIQLTTRLALAASAFDANLTQNIFPTTIATGDFNGDHIFDLLVANTGTLQGQSATVSLFLGLGNTSYALAQNISVGQIPTAVATGDFNHDGKLDFAATNSAEGTVSIVLGNGDGTFAPQVQISVGVDPESIVAADFNHDQILDLAVSQGTFGGVKLLIGQGTGGIGNGTFVVGNGYTVGAGAVNLIAADLNRDQLSGPSHDQQAIEYGFGPIEQRQREFSSAKQLFGRHGAHLHCSGRFQRRLQPRFGRCQRGIGYGNHPIKRRKWHVSHGREN